MDAELCNLKFDINEDFESACRYIDAKIKEKIG